MAEKTEKTGVQLPAMDVFKKATDEQLTRLAQVLDESSKMQSKWMQAGQQQIDDGAELAKSSLKYFTELSTEWNRITIDSTKKALEFFAAR